MSTTLTTKAVPEVSSRLKARMVGVFYFLTFLAGGIFLFAGARLGIVADLSATVSFIAVTVLFYTLNKGT